MAIQSGFYMENWLEKGLTEGIDQKTDESMKKKISLSLFFSKTMEIQKQSLQARLT